MNVLPILLGSQFAWLDILAYLAGIALVYLANQPWVSRFGPG